MQVQFPQKPQIEIIGADAMVAALEQGTALDAAQTVGRAAMDAALTDWQTACDAVKVEASAKIAAMRQQATVLTEQAANLTAQAANLTEQADQIEREVYHG
jgi:hypothetical protein